MNSFNIKSLAKTLIDLDDFSSANLILRSPTPYTPKTITSLIRRLLRIYGEDSLPLLNILFSSSSDISSIDISPSLDTSDLHTLESNIPDSYIEYSYTTDEQPLVSYKDNSFELSSVTSTEVSTSVGTSSYIESDTHTTIDISSLHEIQKLILLTLLDNGYSMTSGEIIKFSQKILYKFPNIRDNPSWFESYTSGGKVVNKLSANIREQLRRLYHPLQFVDRNKVSPDKNTYQYALTDLGYHYATLCSNEVAPV